MAFLCLEADFCLRFVLISYKIHPTHDISFNSFINFNWLELDLLQRNIKRLSADILFVLQGICYIHIYFACCLSILLSPKINGQSKWSERPTAEPPLPPRYPLRLRSGRNRRVLARRGPLWEPGRPCCLLSPFGHLLQNMKFQLVNFTLCCFSGQLNATILPAAHTHPMSMSCKFSSFFLFTLRCKLHVKSTTTLAKSHQINRNV